ncbi:MAG: deoxyhypusine synthase family protein [Acidobacteria bacterium]|nr:deoxyhypusine synthase family protein [Acidobacteriota bacterium]
MSCYSVQPLDITKLATYPLAARQSKVTTADFAQPLTDGASVNEFFNALPNILAAKDLRELASLIRAAKRQQRPVIVGLGGHVIKTGVAPVLIDLLQRGLVSALVMNGAAMIHDFEIALVGQTSEDVDATLGSGAFGMAEETGTFINAAINQGATDGLGMGESVARHLHSLNPPHAEQSLLCASYEARVPLTVHVALGTDIIHIHRNADGASLGKTSLQDFRLLCALVRELHEGGVYLNIGSAVILPEVFLKTVTVVRNLGYALNDFTTANFDFLQHYRPLTNVVKRPVAGVGRGYSFTGHHEIMIPLLAAAILEAS